MKALLRLTAALVILALFAGCASTKLTGIWVEPERPLSVVKKVLVIAVARKLANRQMVEHDFVDAFDTILLETRLFNVSREKLIWSAQSETFDPASVEELSSGLTSAVLERLAEDGLLER
jgi:hypothetical protein